MDPEVKIIENFISVEDCNCFINTYKDRLERSKMLTSIQPPIMITGKRMSDITERRTSTSYNIPRNDPISISLLSKSTDLLKVDINCTNVIQMSRYEKGQYFKTHYDIIPNEPNQREYTVIIYLNDLEDNDGGKTVFPLCNISITPKTGRAIYFKNCDSDGNRITKSIHSGGEILTDTVKYVLTIFVRQRPH